MGPVGSQGQKQGHHVGNVSLPGEITGTEAEEVMRRGAKGFAHGSDVGCGRKPQGVTLSCCRKEKWVISEMGKPESSYGGQYVPKE